MAGQGNHHQAGEYGSPGTNPEHCIPCDQGWQRQCSNGEVGEHPKNRTFAVLSLALVIAAMFAIGLLITAIAPAPQVGGVLGAVCLDRLLFFARLGVPRQKHVTPAAKHTWPEAAFCPAGRRIGRTRMAAT